ncbi:MAG: coniferyl aldehyde dehydrogenase [Pseudomonadales bacterium]
MTAVEQASAVSDSSTELQDLLTLQRDAFLKEGHVAYNTRIDRLDRCISLLVDNQPAICDALAADYGGRSARFTRMSEVMTSVGNLKNTKKHLKKWMKPERRRSPVPMNFLGAKASVHYQPKGVIGNMTPWNVPIGMIFSPLADIIGAGNRAMIKPSEFNPQTAELMKELVGKYFDPAEVSVITGGPEVGAAFSSLAFDHLLFTGATTIGRLVMRSAAENLTPVTLELGGKSPVIVGASAKLEDAVGKIITGKAMNCGQLCISPDYVFVPEDKVEQFVSLCQKEFEAQYPSAISNPDYNAMIAERHYERIQGYLTDANSQGAHIVNLDSSGAAFDSKTKKIPLHIIVDPSDDLQVMQDEVFGPIMLVKPYQQVSDCIHYINARPRPLALYYFGADSNEQATVLDNTISGGATVNNVMFHFSCDDLPFGGVGSSGIGHYHGFDGFRTFSHAKGVFKDGFVNLVKLAGMLPPYGEKTDKMLDSQIKK